MRTARALTVSPSILCFRGGVPGPEGVYLVREVYLVLGGVSGPKGGGEYLV